MFATLCSKPAATNAATGKTTAITLPNTVRALDAIQVARQTMVLARMPEKKIAHHDRLTL